MQVRSVTDVTLRIKALIEEDPQLADLWLEGEVSNFRQASSGHCYFTLKDSDSEIRCVMWRGVAARQPWLPDQGDWVEAHGYVSVYERGGAYQFYADILQQSGVGQRWQQFLELKARLEAEGLFDEERKRPLPEWPKRIGVVTSATGAAFRDICNVLGERYPLVEVVLAPSLVQGASAPAAIVSALGALDEQPGIDVIIVARGGGSMEDLWAFNDEGVARAIAACRVPVVTGVGHETDFTIVDFVSDYRAPTPSAAAAAVVPDRYELHAQLLGSIEAMTDSMEAIIGRWRQALEHSEHILRLHDPSRTLGQYRQALDDLVHRAEGAIAHQLELAHTRLDGLLAGLKALSPALVMARGYAIVSVRDTGQALRSVHEVVQGDGLLIQVIDGRVDAVVQETEKQGGPTGANR